MIIIIITTIENTVSLIRLILLLLLLLLLLLPPQSTQPPLPPSIPPPPPPPQQQQHQQQQEPQQSQQQELRLRKLRELAPKKKNGNRRFRSWRERVRFYSTSTLAFFSVTAGASLLFLVPLYVDPAISTLSHDFIEQPTLCTTTRRENLIGIFNCSWSSCREGCTSDLYRCVHIYVTFIEQNITIPENMTDFTNYTAEWEQSDEATLLVNIKGCGYPPTVTCSKFNALYGIPGAIFPCYYSRKNKTVVMTSYNHEDQVFLSNFKIWRTNIPAHIHTYCFMHYIRDEKLNISCISKCKRYLHREDHSGKFIRATCRSVMIKEQLAMYGIHQ
uniref:Protein tipE n=1 Tax=Glossina austeni TaxID=7395 RepID=A0A1A9UNH5_GLOAU